MRFLLDEHVHPAVATGLRLRGIDATTAAEAGLLGEPDERYVEVAASENRVVVTHDDDFLVLHTREEPRIPASPTAISARSRSAN